MIPKGTAMRASIIGGPEGLEIVIPAPRNLFALVFLGTWLMAWIVGEVSALAGLGSGGRLAPDAFLALWLAFWTVGGCFAGYSWLWMLAGKERILMGASSLRVKRDSLGLGRTRAYALHRIRNLSVATGPILPSDPRAVFKAWGIIGGRIAFDYEGKTIRFGSSLEEAEARMIVDRMRARFAFPDMPTVS